MAEMDGKRSQFQRQQQQHGLLYLLLFHDLPSGGWYSEIGISSFLKPEIPAVGKEYKEYKIGIPLPFPQSSPQRRKG
jgi:hypothetical protein